jgi:GNAT superfamily N-acetyltransferase
MFRIIPEGAHFSEYGLLRDGQPIFLRTASADDIVAVEAFLKTVSRASLQMRFMGAVAAVPRSVIETMCTGEPRDRLSLLAILGQGPESRIVGIGNYISVGTHGRAEVAFLVHDDFQGRGISTLLLERLAGIAAAQGFVGFEAEILYDNQAMINVLRDSGFEICQAWDGSGIHVQFPVSGMASLHERVPCETASPLPTRWCPCFSPRRWR